MTPLRFPRLVSLASLLAAGAGGCSDDVVSTGDRERILGVPVTENHALTGLEGEAYVLRTEGDVPHVYARSRKDLARVQGFVMARDRYFMMDLARRRGLGTLTELLGDAALATDQEARGSGGTHVADRLLEHLDAELGEYLDGFAAGVNDYIDLVRDEELPPPSELELAGVFLGASRPADLMKPFARRDVTAMVAVVIYQTSFETGDVGRAATAARLDSLYEGAALEELRRAGARRDLWERIEPVMPVSSAPGFGVTTGSSGSTKKKSVTSAPSGQTANHTAGSDVAAATRSKAIPLELLDRLATRLAAQQKSLLRDKEAGFGSNAWAVAGSKTTDGAALLAGDGHLDLTVPSILYNLGLDTSVFGAGTTHQLGLTIPGFPVMPIGTNGRVAWSQTQLMGDVTDWYREEIRLDAEGRPADSFFQGSWRPLLRTDETFVVADVPLLGSKGRTETWSRWTTFDGRVLADIEGRVPAEGEALSPGEALVTMRGQPVVPGDTDGDQVITAVSFDYTGFDIEALLATTNRLGHADDIHAFRDATRGLVAYSQNFAVADDSGSILYTSYQTVPCRGYLPRQADGSWALGADPNLILDGTLYGGFRIPQKDGAVDEAPGASDPYACVVPFERMPQAIDPDAGYVATANNDPGNLSTDGSLTNDEHYIGGPWDVGFRADTISRELEASIAAGEADVAAMSRIQGNVRSRLGELFTPAMLEAIEKGRALAAKGSGSPAEQRVAALYQAEAAAFDEVEARLVAWRAAGHEARSGVATFYATPTEQDRVDAVATMIFNAWMGHAMTAVFDDEGLPGVFQGGSGGRVRALHRFLEGRGPGNPGQLASYNPDTEESAFFDVLGTDEVETSREVLLQALADALAFLRAPPTAKGEGGFGTADMSRWLWGLRHVVRFESLLGTFIGDEPKFAVLADQFAITTKQAPLAVDLKSDDPRSDLQWFPRDGDQFSVDAANPGLSGKRFSYGSGPVMRMVVSLQNGEVSGRNIIPGGQSALIESPHFADQAPVWLANDTLPLRFSVPDVVEGATGREVYRPR